MGSVGQQVNLFCRTHADVAQPVEQRFRKPPVGSSSLPVGSEILREFAPFATALAAGGGLVQQLCSNWVPPGEAHRPTVIARAARGVTDAVARRAITAGRGAAWGLSVPSASWLRSRGTRPRWAGPRRRSTSRSRSPGPWCCPGSARWRASHRISLTVRTRFAPRASLVLLPMLQAPAVVLARNGPRTVSAQTVRMLLLRGRL